MTGNICIAGTFVVWRRHRGDAETECPVLSVGSGVLYEDAGKVAGSPMMLTTHYHCLKGGSMESVSLALFGALSPHCSFHAVGHPVFLH